MINVKIKLNDRPTGEWIDYILFNWFGGIERISLHLYNNKNFIKYELFKV